MKLFKKGNSKFWITGNKPYKLFTLSCILFIEHDPIKFEPEEKEKGITFHVKSKEEGRELYEVFKKSFRISGFATSDYAPEKTIIYFEESFYDNGSFYNAFTVYINKSEVDKFLETIKSLSKLKYKTAWRVNNRNELCIILN